MRHDSPSTHKDDDEDAKRFDLLILRRQLAQLEGDAVAAERLREQIQLIAAGLLNQTAIPSVAAQQVLLDEVAGRVVGRCHAAHAGTGPP